MSKKRDKSFNMPTKKPLEPSISFYILLLILSLVLICVAFWVLAIGSNSKAQASIDTAYPMLEINDKQYVEQKHADLEEPQVEQQIEFIEETEEIEEYYCYPEAYCDTSNFYTLGEIYDENGIRYTWYSENVLPGEGLYELNENGRWVDEYGYIRDGDGYLAVASEDYEKGTVVDTPFGLAKVYDCGCDYGTIDMYVSW